MTPVPRLDYSKTPSGYGEIRAVGFEDGTFWSIGHESGLGFRGGETADVPREKAGDPPTAWCVALHGQPHFTAFTEPEADACRPDVETQVRAAAWAWYDRRLAIAAGFDALGSDPWPWPECLSWSDKQASTAELHLGSALPPDGGPTRG